MYVFAMSTDALQEIIQVKRPYHVRFDEERIPAETVVSPSFELSTTPSILKNTHNNNASTNDDNFSKPITGTTGSIFSTDFLQRIEPLYDMHMGVENMAPLLYTLIRFTKPIHVSDVQIQIQIQI